MPGEEITALLQAWSTGTPSVKDRLFDLVYPELRRLAIQNLSRERSGVSIQATELVHETYLKLVDQRQCEWRCRAQFFAIAATFIRRILVDLAKHHRRHKRGGGSFHLSIDEVLLPGLTPDLNLLALDNALVELARIRMTAAQIVELRFFAGLGLDETAQVLSLSRTTVQRRWRFAKAWLRRELSGD